MSNNSEQGFCCGWLGRGVRFSTRMLKKSVLDFFNHDLAE